MAKRAVVAVVEPVQLRGQDPGGQEEQRPAAAESPGRRRRATRRRSPRHARRRARASAGAADRADAQALASRSPPPSSANDVRGTLPRRACTPRVLPDLGIVRTDSHAASTVATDGCEKSGERGLSDRARARLRAAAAASPSRALDARGDEPEPPVLAVAPDRRARSRGAAAARSPARSSTSASWRYGVAAHGSSLVAATACERAGPSLPGARRGLALAHLDVGEERRSPRRPRPRAATATRDGERGGARRARSAAVCGSVAGATSSPSTQTPTSVTAVSSHIQSMPAPTRYAVERAEQRGDRSVRSAPRARTQPPDADRDARRERADEEQEADDPELAERLEVERVGVPDGVRERAVPGPPRLVRPGAAAVERARCGTRRRAACQNCHRPLPPPLRRCVPTESAGAAADAVGSAGEVPERVRREGRRRRPRRRSRRPPRRRSRRDTVRRPGRERGRQLEGDDGRDADQRR